MGEVRYFLTRKQIERERICIPLIKTDNWIRPAMINIEDERDIREEYHYEYDIKSKVEQRLGLTEAMVDAVMNMILSGVDNVTIATQTGLPVTTVFEIQSGNIYKDKTVRMLMERANLYPKDQQLRNDQKEAIVKLWLDKYTYKEISKITNIDVPRVKDVAKNMNYNQVLHLPGAREMVHNKKLPPRLIQRLDIYQEDAESNKINTEYKKFKDMTPEDIKWISQKILEGYGVTDIMRMGGYAKDAVRYVRRGYKTTMKYCPNYIPPRKIGESTVLAMPTYKVIGICQELQRGDLYYRDIAEKYGVSEQSVWKIRKRTAFRDISKNYTW